MSKLLKYPAWKILFNKENEDMFIFKWFYTKGTKYAHNGDVYTNVVHNGILCTYIIDLGLDNTLGDDIEKYNIEHILKSKESLSEVVYYNYGKLYNDEIYEVLIFNEHYNIHFYIMDEEHNNHCSTHSATFKYKLKIGNFIIVDEEYYIHGKKCSEIEHSRVQKMRKIKQTMLKRI